MRMTKIRRTVLVTWILGLVVFLALVPVTAQEPPALYEDPQGRFSAAVPEGWTVESTNDYVLMTGEPGVSVYLLVVEGEGVEAGIEMALEITGQDVAGQEPVQSNQIPSPNGVWQQDVYVLPDGRMVIGLAQADEGMTYVMIVSLPNADALTTAQAAINQILLSFAIGERIDLSDVEAQPLTEAMLADLTATIEAGMEEYSVTGAAVAVVQNGEVVFSRGFGFREAGGEPVTSETLFMIGSTTKPITTMMMATLVDDGILDWDTPVIEILPSFALSDPEVTPQIRVRDLVSMSTGVPRYDTPLLLQRQTVEEVLAEPATIPLLAAPGEAFHYSNYMVAAGGFISALAAGATLGEDVYETYVRLVEERIFEPIGMDDTTFDFDAALAGNHAMPVTFDFEAGEFVALPIDFERFVTPIAPAGSVWSNAEDMALFMLTAMNGGVAPNGTRVVSEENLAETQTPVIPAPGAGAYGLGWFIDTWNGTRLIYHGGNTSGFTSDFAFLPEKELGVLVLTNRAVSNNFSATVRDHVFELAFGLEHTAAERYRAAEAALYDLLAGVMAGVETEPVTDRGTVENYLGEYERGVTLAFNSDDQLVLDVPYGELPVEALVGEENAFLTTGLLGGFRLDFDESGDQVTMTVSPIFQLDGPPLPLELEKVS